MRNTDACSNRTDLQPVSAGTDSGEAQSAGNIQLLDLQYAPKDTTAVCDTLQVTMQATFAVDAELELNVVTKSNDQTGPGASFGVTRTMFGGGES